MDIFVDYSPKMQLESTIAASLLVGYQKFRKKLLLLRHLFKLLPKIAAKLYYSCFFISFTKNSVKIYNWDIFVDYSPKMQQESTIGTSL